VRFERWVGSLRSGRRRPNPSRPLARIPPRYGAPTKNERWSVIPPGDVEPDDT
jgi:hypothetical protein